MYHCYQFDRYFVASIRYRGGDLYPYFDTFRRAKCKSFGVYKILTIRCSTG